MNVDCTTHPTNSGPRSVNISLNDSYFPVQLHKPNPQYKKCGICDHGNAKEAVIISMYPPESIEDSYGDEEKGVVRRSAWPPTNE